MKKVTITLDHVQRLNLVVLIDVAKLQNNELRAYWEIQDSLKLSDEEGEQIGLHFQPMQGGGQAPLWDPKKKLSTEAREFEFSKDQITKLKKVVQQADLNAAQRTWLEPLMDQLEA